MSGSNRLPDCQTNEGQTTPGTSALQPHPEASHPSACAGPPGATRTYMYVESPRSEDQGLPVKRIITTEVRVLLRSPMLPILVNALEELLVEPIAE